MKKDYKQVLGVLEMVFDAERRYFEIAEEVHIAELKRFLNHQRVERNKFANEMAGVCAFNSIETEILCIKKSNSTKTGLATKEGIEKPDYLSMMKMCLAYDEDIIEACAILIRDKSIPVDILEIATRLMTFLIFQAIEGNQLIEEIKAKEYQKGQVKVVQLRNSFL